MRINPRRIVPAAVFSLLIAVSGLYGYIHDHRQAGADPLTAPIVATGVDTSAPEQYWGSLQAVRLRAVADDSVDQTRHYQVDLTLSNKTTTVLEFSPGLQVFVVDQQGQRYAATAQYTPADQAIGGPIASNGTWQGTLDFVVPATQQPVQLRVEKDASSQPLTEKL